MPDDAVVPEPAALPGTTVAGAPRAGRRSMFKVVAGVVAVSAVVVGIAVWRANRSSSSDAGAAVPHFVDEARSAGIRHIYAGNGDYFVGGGVATFDCNADGRPDLYFAGGSGAAALYRNDSAVGGALKFTALPSPVTDLTAVTGAYPIDIDSDGIADLVVLRRGGNHVLRGLGDCRFQDANDALGIAAGHDWTVAFSAMWEGTNTMPTLAFGSYRVPDADTCGDNRLVRPVGTTRAYAPAIALSPGYCSLSVLFSDWAHDGHPDLRVANDRNYYINGREQLWKIRQGVAPQEYTAADGWHSLQIWGMGIASRDLDGDGLPEVYITSQGDNKLQTLEHGPSAPSFHDIALAKGVTAQRPYTGGDVLPSTAWHPEFEDVNNDGLVDLFVSKGNVDAQPDNAQRDPSNLFIGRPDGTFFEGAPAAGIVRYDRARGAALVDLNLDGLLDLVVVNREVNVAVWRNVGSGDAARPIPMGHWLELGLHQPAPNVDAIGAWVDVRVAGRTTVREITIGGGHASGKLGWIHTGLGDATSAEVRVHWPNGDTGPWTTIQADRFVTIDRGAATPTVFTPAG
jgi:hypothetical protein